MLNFDSLALKFLLNEIVPVLTSGRIQKVQQPSRREILLGIRASGKSFKLYINIDPRYPHIALLSNEGEELRNIEIPQKPPMFCMLLRKHMEGAKINTIRQPDYERILEVHFESYGEMGDRVSLVLAVELMGKHSNIVLYNCNNKIILGCAHNVGSEKSRERELAGGLPYIYPSIPDKIDLLDTTKEDFYSKTMITAEPLNIRLNADVHHMSLALASELCKFVGIKTEKNRVIAASQEKIFDLYEIAKKIISGETLNPVISRDFSLYSLAGIDKDIDWQCMDYVNNMLNVYFGYHINKDIVERIKIRLLAPIKKELKRNKTKNIQHQKSVESDEKAEKYRQIGDILISNLYRIPAGVDFVELENPYNDNEVEKIAFDVSLSPNENAQRYYKLYNKLKNASKIAKELMRKLAEEREYLESIESAVELSEKSGELREMQEEMNTVGLLNTKETKQEKDKKIKIELDERIIEDFKIFIGKNNKQNDYLVSKIASQNDIWLHTHNIPGSHVLIKIPPENLDVPDKVLLEAAKLAAYYSQARGSAKVPVIYTRRKFLKKPPATRPGYVIYTNEKVIFVN